MYLAIFLLLERRYFNWPQAIPAWKIDMKDSRRLPESNGLSYEERYVKLYIDNQIEHYDSFIFNPR